MLPWDLLNQIRRLPNIKILFSFRIKSYNKLSKDKSQKWISQLILLLCKITRSL